MKVIHCLRNYFPDKTGGTEIYVRGLCKALAAFGVSVVIVKPNFSGTAASYVFDGISIKEYNETASPTVSLQSGVEPPAGLQAFKNILLEEQPNAVHFHETAGSTGITIYHLKAAKALGFTVFSTFHLAGNICMRNTFLYKGKHTCDGIIKINKCAACMLHYRGVKGVLPNVIAAVSPFINKKIAGRGIKKLFNYPLYIQKHYSDLQMVNKLSARMFVLSNWYRNLAIANGMDAQKITLLPPAVDMRSFAADKRLPLQNGKPMLFIYAGRIAKIKGLEVAIDALVALPSSNWELHIYGNVYDEAYYKRCLGKANNNHNIHWKAAVPHEVLLTILPQYHALLFPSLVQETMGLIVLEAMAAGLAVIGSNIWSVQEFTTNGRYGFLFEPGNTKALTELLQNILGQPSLLQTKPLQNTLAGGMELVAEKTFEAYSSVTVQP